MRGLMGVLCVVVMGGLAAPTFAVAADLAVSVSQQGPTRANVINPCELLDQTREQLAQRYPSLPAAELDKLVFKIADINSMRSLPR